MVGYQPGYGEIRDYTPQSGTASYSRGRVFAIVAIKNGMALGMIGSGPYYEFSPRKYEPSVRCQLDCRRGQQFVDQQFHVEGRPAALSPERGESTAGALA